MDRLQQTLAGVISESGPENGSVGIIGGTIEYPNQPAIVGRAALRTGTDHVRALVPADIYGIVASHSPNLLVSQYADNRFTEDALEQARDLAEWADALVIGPGLLEASPDAVQATITDAEVPTVVDALAIEPALEADLSQTVLTPSESEDDPIRKAYGSLETFSAETGAVLTLTGDVDVIITDGERSRNETGTSALTVAGTGDTFAGITASLLGQGMDRDEAAELGAWILGKTGELATADKGPGVVATDVIERIPDTIR